MYRREGRGQESTEAELWTHKTQSPLSEQTFEGPIAASFLEQNGNFWERLRRAMASLKRSVLKSQLAVSVLLTC